ncbi:LytR/AlgR family response regulator transcription factor [Polaribacter aestuariivivens]|uniref:LytR/AlgR family response regulator transcription factor n=1 Tax=Polaribacter aestuariivivens TaxID=2304626 RepID=UPI003F497A88
MNEYKTLIVDDDIDNIKILEVYINKFFPSINIVGQAHNVNDAVKKYLNKEPDILLLDIELDNDTIFSFIDAIGKVNSEIIFISSHPEFGVKAVNYNVTGFIVKPIDIQQFKKIINKAICNIENKKNINKVLQEKALINNVGYYPINIAIPSIHKIELISIKDCIYLEADGKYTIFHLKNGKKKIACRNMGEYEKILDPKVFFRVHHGYIININMVANIHKTDGTYCELISGNNIPIAKRRQEVFFKFLKLK